MCLVDRCVRVTFADSGAKRLFRKAFGEIHAAEAGTSADLSYRVGRDGGGFVIERSHGGRRRVVDEADLLFEFESDLAVALQRMRPDLFFLHAGVVVSDQGAALLVGESGAGKSTLTRSLVDAGLAYSSDELAPICLGPPAVHAYPRAISLKGSAAWLPGLSAEGLTTRTGVRVPIPVREGVLPDPHPIQAIFFLVPANSPASSAVRLRRVGVAEAAARLLSNALNPGAHHRDGLDAAFEVASSAAGFELPRSDLAAMRDAVVEALGRSGGTSPA